MLQWGATMCLATPPLLYNRGPGTLANTQMLVQGTVQGKGSQGLKFLAYLHNGMSQPQCQCGSTHVFLHRARGAGGEVLGESLPTDCMESFGKGSFKRGGKVAGREPPTYRQSKLG